MRGVDYIAKNCYIMSCPSCHIFMNICGTSLVHNERVKCYKCGAHSKARKWKPVVKHKINNGGHEYE